MSEICKRCGRAKDAEARCGLPLHDDLFSELPGVGALIRDFFQTFAIQDTHHAFEAE